MIFGYNNNMKYDVIIIGAGPAGLSAGIFTTRAGLNTACFERLAIGGQASLSYDISNYPGFNKISGIDLMDKMHAHATELGVETIYEDVLSLTKAKDGFFIKTKSEKYTAKQVIIASGCTARKLGLENEDKLTGRGISYCASCDGNFYRDKIVGVVGGGDTAFENVDYLSRLAKKVYLINRSEKFKAGEYKLNQVKRYKNVEILTNAKLVALHGKDQLEKVSIDINGENQDILIDGLFIAIGQEPYLNFVDIDIELDPYGYIIVDQHMNTNIKGLYACGDVTSKEFRQVITACSDGAIAGNSCIKGESANDKR